MNQVPPSTPPLFGLARLMSLALAGSDLTELSARLVERANTDPSDANALLDMAVILQFKGNRELALAVQGQALATQRLYRIAPAAGTAPGLRLLALVGPGDLMSNMPLECLLDGADVDLHLVYLLPGEGLPEHLPAHDLLAVALGESEQNRPILQALATPLAAWPKPVLNRPERLAKLSRDSVAALLADAPGLAVPTSRRVDRERLAALGRGETSVADLLGEGGFPVILRPVDSHAGQGLEKLDDAAAVAAYLEHAAQPEFFLAPFIDYRNADGQFRKYRIVLIGGRPYVAHMAISSHWMIHYANAGMADSAAKRAEEAAFMAAFDTDFAPRHTAGFRAIDERLGLDYVGIDCAESPDGRLLIFEVDHAMVVHALDPVDLYPYKQPQMRKVFAAFRALLDRKAGRA